MKHLSKLFAVATVAVACIFARPAVAQPTTVSRPTAVPMFTTIVSNQTATAAAGTALPFAVSPYHNVNFQFDLWTTNNGTSNLVFTFDTSMDNSSWKNASHTITQAATGTSTNTYITTISNVPAYYMRLNQISTTQTNTIQVNNMLYWPFP